VLYVRAYQPLHSSSKRGNGTCTMDEAIKDVRMALYLYLTQINYLRHHGYTTTLAIATVFLRNERVSQKRLRIELIERGYHKIRLTLRVSGHG
jgi:hypothetical protein